MFGDQSAFARVVEAALLAAADSGDRLPTIEER
jgi:hypothetical protein